MIHGTDLFKLGNMPSPDKWATPIYQADYGDNAAKLNEFLLDLIMRREAGDGTISLGVFNAKKSSTDLLQSNTPEIARLSSWIFEALIALNEATMGPDSRCLDDDIIAEAWAVVYRDDGYHKLHSHHDSAWSGVYYVSTGDMIPGSGRIEFVDPRPCALMSGGSGERSLVTIDPHPGRLIAFPSWLTHSVSPVKCANPRVCIAFNATFDKGQDIK